MKQRKVWKISILFVLLILSGLVSLYLGGITSPKDLKRVIFREAGSIATSSLDFQGYVQKEGKYISTNDDACFYTGEIRQYIKDLTITFGEPLIQDIEIQIYYANSNGGFADNVPLSAKAVQGQRSVLFVPDDDIDYLRIDITTQAQQSFDLQAITYNSNGYFGFSKGNFICRTLILWVVSSFLAAHLLFDVRKMYAWLDRNRFYIGIGVVVFCVIFEIHGSSLAEWVEFMPSNVDKASDTLFGISRDIRSDEWATFTPMSISQSFGELPYSWFGDILRGTVTDMFTVYAQPVATPFIVFRPFLSGFLFLGTSRGLAFFWSARLVALILVSYEFFKFITKNKVYSLAAAALIAWAPLVQWWFAINGLVEMLIFAQLSLIMLDYYMKTNSFLKRCIALLVIDICAGGFVLTLYPAWQIPIFYIILATALSIVLENYKCCKITGKDALSIAVAVLVLVLSVGIIFYISFDTIKLVMNTAYPGSRVGVGGNCTWLDLFKSWGNIFFSMKSEGIPMNACESSMFVDFFPMGFILALYVLVKKKKKDFLLVFLLIIACIMGLYSLVGVPEFLAKLTGLSFSNGNRVMMVMGFLNIMLLFRALGSGEIKLTLKSILAVCLVFSIIVGISVKLYYMNYLSEALLVIVAVISFIGVFCVLKQTQIVTAVFLVVLSLICGALVNPVQRGCDIIYQFPMADVLKEIEQSDKGKWAMVNCEYPRTDYLLVYGLSTVNSTNTYPAFEVWQKLDESGIYEDVYNRYAHITLWVSEEDHKEKFELTNADAFQVNVTIEDLEKIDVKYILSGENLDEYVQRDQLSLLAADSGYYIYEIKK